MTFAVAKDPLCALVHRNSQMTTTVAPHPNAMWMAQWSFYRGGIVQCDTEINEQLTAAWKEWSDFKFL